jgi:hypothetical protein
MEKRKETVRVSFDVPIEEHTFLKTECTKSRIPFRNLMRQVFHKTVEELRKKQLHDMLNQGFQQSYEGKTTRLTKEQLNQWNELLSDE